MASLEATWDSADDWPLFTATGGADSAATRVTSPGVKYLGAVGRLTDAWTGGAGAFDIYRSVELTPARTARWAIALRPIELAWGGGGVQTRNGPLMIRCRNDAGGTLGMRARLNVLRDAAGNLEMRFYESSASSVSAEMVNLRARSDSWLLFKFELESTGAAAPYTVHMTCRVFEARGTREKFLTALVVPAPATDIFDFAGFAIGFLSLEKNSDSFDLHVDECRIGTGEDVPYPRPRRGGLADFPLTVRIRRWDEGASTWRSAWEVAASDVRDLSCRFLAHRVEEACDLIIGDPGGIWATKTQDVLADIEQRAGSLYRLDIHCPQEEVADPTFPAGWRDPPIFWSGVLNAKSFRINKASRQVEIVALGWTSMLERFETTSRYFTAGTTLSDVVDDALADLNVRWPGAVVRLPDDPGSSVYTRVLASKVIARQVPIAELLSQLTTGGSFFFGISCSGYPLDDDDEFRLIFFESRAEIRAARGEVTADSLVDTTWKTFDVEDARVRAWERSVDEEDIGNRWVFKGKPFHLDIRPDFTVATSGPDFILDRLRSLLLLDYDVPNGGTLEPFEGTLAEFIGHALSPGDPGTAGFPAGLIDEVPEAMQGERVITEVLRNSAAATFFDLEEAFTSDPPVSGYLLSVLRNQSMPRVRTAEDRSQTGVRESITKVIDDPDVDGWYLANLRAMRELFAKVRNSRRARLTIVGWRGPPGDQLRNVLGVLEGGTRITRYGTTGEGGDGFEYGSDTRPLGAARHYEVRTVDAAWNEGGWEMTFTLGSAPLDLSSRLRPEALE